ncbi:hypothetical protein [Nocardia noduli]|uniref:hypothetical protein n=1 Tax=Nocardia noduli TaxID=2815722 RepID=UPI001C2500BB|nr:hypothetical protein [Nocardia noduli]
MTEQRVRATRLASELGTNLVALLGLMHDLGVSAPNGNSGISVRDAATVREWFDNERRRVSEERAAQIRRENSALLDSYHDMQAPRDQRIGELRPKYACACCGRNVGRPSSALIELEADLYCPRCDSHYEQPDEPADRELERLRAHDADLRSYARRAWLAQNVYRDKMKAAYRSRDTWRTTLAEVVLPHEPDDDGLCQVCRRPSPCPVWTVLEETNLGVYRDVENLATLDEDEREKLLHPARFNDSDFEDMPW